MVYLVQILYSNVFQHCPATVMKKSDEASPSIILAGRAPLVKMLITLGLDAIFFFKFCIIMYFNIVQPLVCKTVRRLHRASCWPVELF